jgi:hypothetical protein
MSSKSLQSPSKLRYSDRGVEGAPQPASSNITAECGNRQSTNLDREVPWATPVTGIARAIEVKIASERAEWEQAFQMVGASYQARGYGPAARFNLRFPPYHALPDTVTFVAKEGLNVIASLSLVLDNALLGLPMESIYPTEIDELRAAGRRLVEVTGLADDGLNTREFIPVFVALMRLMTQYCLSQAADAMVIAINPRHRIFYRRVLGFVPLGPCRAYPAVQNHPAEAYLLDEGLLRTNAPAIYQRVIGERLPPQALVAPVMPRHLVLHFASHSTQNDSELIREIFSFVDSFGSPRRW